MDDSFKVSEASKPALNTPLNQSSLRRWQARLNLDFTESKGRSYLARNLHAGPLVLQKTLHPEGESVCHGVVIHPPGGVAGGDELTINVTLAEKTRALLTTPGAGKWYKANGQFATQNLHFDLKDHACFEWLPQENILFDGSQVRLFSTVNLAPTASFATWEILCLGRQAQREQWLSGVMQQTVSIRRAGKLIWNERALLKPEHKTFKSMLGLKSNAVTGSFVVAAGAIPIEVLEACKAIKPKLALDADAQYGVTALPEVFAARYVGLSSQCAKAYFESLWACLRPWYAQRDAHRPRIWNT